ncbi:HAD-IIIA family hydrolase [Alkalihalobacillus berkeleyi]|uniref:HAD-IIIA family hydrolase n=1 Tax=Pseudalkalibacillus berkeleyi TaxID=1069813 RepID=A0ABS9H598_9BACL|nr:HAD-IIIA family hydrolase [Pseudalkalibacillus berkeleyi]
MEDYPDEQWSHVSHPQFKDGAIETLQEVQSKGYEIIIITNQYLINEGFITFERYESITKQMIDVLQRNGIHIKDIFYCPHRRDEGCNCLKPNTGMVDQEVKQINKILRII